MSEWRTYRRRNKSWLKEMNKFKIKNRGWLKQWILKLSMTRLMDWLIDGIPQSIFDPYGTQYAGTRGPTNSQQESSLERGWNSALDTIDHKNSTQWPYLILSSSKLSFRLHPLHFSFLNRHWYRLEQAYSYSQNEHYWVATIHRLFLKNIQ